MDASLGDSRRRPGDICRGVPSARARRLEPLAIGPGCDGEAEAYVTQALSTPSTGSQLAPKQSRLGRLGSVGDPARPTRPRCDDAAQRARHHLQSEISASRLLSRGCRIIRRLSLRRRSGCRQSSHCRRTPPSGGRARVGGILTALAACLNFIFVFIACFRVCPLFPIGVSLKTAFCVWVVFACFSLS